VIEQGPARRLLPALEEALFRIAQEALTNVAKYARAGKVVVTLDTTRAEKHFGFRARTSFEVGLRQTIDSYRETVRGPGRPLAGRVLD